MLIWTAGGSSPNRLGRWSSSTRHPDVRLRDLACWPLDVTERTAFELVADLYKAGYVIKDRDGRRNRYHVQANHLVPDSMVGDRTIAEVLPLAESVPAFHNRRHAAILEPVTFTARVHTLCWGELSRATPRPPRLSAGGSRETPGDKRVWRRDAAPNSLPEHRLTYSCLQTAKDFL